MGKLGRWGAIAAVIGVIGVMMSARKQLGLSLGWDREAALQWFRNMSDLLGFWAIPAYVGIHTLTLALCLPYAVFFEAGASLLFGFIPAVLCVFSAKVLGASLSFWIGRCVFPQNSLLFFFVWFFVVVFSCGRGGDCGSRNFFKTLHLLNSDSHLLMNTGPNLSKVLNLFWMPFTFRFTLINITRYHILFNNKQLLNWNLFHHKLTLPNVALIVLGITLL